MKPSLKQELNAILDSYARSFSGTCLVRSRAETFVSCAYGFANRDFSVPNRIDTRFDTASVTKLYTAVATLLLIERGDLSLTDKIHDRIDLTDTAIPRKIRNMAHRLCL